MNGYAWLSAFVTAGGVEESNGDVCWGRLFAAGVNEAYVVELLSGVSFDLSDRCWLDMMAVINCRVWRREGRQGRREV